MKEKIEECRRDDRALWDPVREALCAGRHIVVKGVCMPPSEIVCQPLFRMVVHFCATDLLDEESTRHSVKRFAYINGGKQGPQGRLRCIKSLMYKLGKCGEERSGRELGPKTVLRG